MTLEGARVRLEPIEPRHEDALWKIAQDPRVWTLMKVRGNESRELFREWFSSIELGFAHYFCFSGDRPETFTPGDPDTPGQGPVPGGPRFELVGHTSYLNVHDDDRVVEIGNTWLAPSAWGTGANTEAKYLLMKHAFEDEGFHRVEFKTDAKNGRARAALAGLGAEFEGVFRKHMVVRGGERRDSAWYAVIDDDWPLVKIGLEQKLSG